MHDGFKPMLPGSGGFRPIFGPTNKSDEEYHSHTYQQEASFNYSQWDFPGNSLPHATVSKVSTVFNLICNKYLMYLFFNDYFCLLCFYTNVSIYHICKPAVSKRKS